MSRPYLSTLAHNSQESLDDVFSVLSQVHGDAPPPRSLYDLHQEFVEEETGQAAGEQARGKEFDEMVAGFNETFETNQQRRERLFLEADVRQQETFRKNEPGRETVFLEGQTSRAATFETHEASRVARSEWHNTARETLLLQGRQGRKEACVAIETALMEQFDKLLKNQEDSFTAEERRRDSIVQKLLEDDKESRSSSFTGYGVNGSTISVPDFVHGVPPMPPMSVVPPTIISSSRSRSPRRSRSPPLQVVIPSLPSYMNGSAPEELSLPVVLDSVEAQLILKSYLENRFQASEAARDEAEAERTNVFKQKERDRSMKFRTLLESHEEHSRGREARRTEGRIRREGFFNTAQARQSQTFDMSLSQIEAKVEADNNLEEDLTKHMKKMIESLNNRQVARLEAEREDQSTRFHEATQRRYAELGAPSSLRFSSPSPSPSSIPVIPPHFAPTISIPSPPHTYPAPQIVMQPAISWRSRSRSRSRSPARRSRSPVRYPLIEPTQVPSSRVRQPRARRPPSPPFGFGAAALFRGANIQRLLPIPGSDYASSIDLSRQIFEKSEERFEDVFKKDIERRRHIFSMNEARRQTEFEKQQRVRRTTFAENEDGREEDFKQAQRRREVAFQAAEQERVIEFHQEESEREAAFGLAQEQRANRFHAKQEELQKKCFEAEQRRFADLDSWGAELLRSRRREQMETYRNEERAREDAFQWWLTAYAAKDDGNLGASIIESFSPPSLKSFRRGRSLFSLKR